MTRLGLGASLALAAVVAAPVLAARPVEVPPDARFDGDGVTLRWTAQPDATSWNVYRGSNPRAGDHACFASGLMTPSFALTDPPPPGGLVYYLVSASNGDGEGTLGARSDGAPRPNRSPCDTDGDTIADAADDCPQVADPAQADQDSDGEGDRCDPQTYDFEGDALGARPADTTWVGGNDPTFQVRDASGDHAASYVESVSGAHDQLDRVDADMPFQDTTVWIDFQDVPQAASIELWSDGAWAWSAGGGLIVQVAGDGRFYFYERLGRSVPQVPGPMLPAGGRVRLRLVKGAGTTSQVHVDGLVGGAWQDDLFIWNIADDHRYRGTATLMANYIGGGRGVERITVNHVVPAATLTLAKDARWSSDWKLFQRDAAGVATIPLRFAYRLGEPAFVTASVVSAATRLPLPGHDAADHRLALPASGSGTFARLDVPGVPSGGNYDVELRLSRASDGVAVGGAVLRDVAVGDVWIAGGQSNMSGYSGSVVGAETPIDEVHLFGNDGLWKIASEPMDSGIDQVDLVSAEGPAAGMLLAFGKSLQAATGVPVGIVPGPLGGTNLFAQWQRDEADHDDRGTLYGSLLHRALLQGGNPPTGFLWYQGESDALSLRGTALYRQDLERLLAEERSDMGAPDLFAGIVQLGVYVSADLTQWIPVQEAERQVVAADPRAVLATVIDQPLADAIHYSVAGYRVLGGRMADGVRERLFGQAVDALVELVGARSVSFGMAVELDLDGNVAGGAPGLFRVTDAAGQPNVTAVTVAGPAVTLTLDRALVLPATVSYGWSVDPAAPWVEDLRGTPIPCFLDVGIAL